MWIFIARAGFFSIVKGDTPDMLRVRARAPADLDRLRSYYVPTLTPTDHTPRRDYGWRAACSKRAFGEAMSKVVNDITFDNFKDRVAVELGNERARVCGRVWSVMRTLQDADAPPTK